MTLRRWSRPLLLLVVGLLSGIGVGCIITTTGGDDGSCGGVLSHSHETGTGTCKCDAGYTWENPDNPDDFDCERIEGKGSGAAACNEAHNVTSGELCYCEGGYIWCSPNDPNDYSCCLDDAQDAVSGTDDPSTTDETLGETSAGSDTGATPDPADCTADAEGAVFCSNTQAAGPEGSQYWVCMGGSWVEMPGAGDELCMFDGYDFAYGCVDDGAQVAFICGNGPGTACNDDAVSSCVDADVINTCLFGRLTQDSCATICNTIGDDMGVTYDSGFCDAEAVPPDCFCCDAGEEGCPV